MIEGVVAACALVIAVALAAVLSGLLMAVAVVALAGVCGGCGWLYQGRLMTKGDDLR